MDDDLIVSPTILAGNNVIFNSWNLSLFGKVPRTT